MRKLLAEAIDDLESIVWEAENQDYFSISDLRPVIRKLVKAQMELKPEKPDPSWSKGFIAWISIPFFILLLPFAYFFSALFRR